MEHRDFHNRNEQNISAQVKDNYNTNKVTGWIQRTTYCVLGRFD